MVLNNDVKMINQLLPFCIYILTHTSNAKCFRNVTLIIRGLAEIIVPVRGYGRNSRNQGYELKGIIGQ